MYEKLAKKFRDSNDKCCFYRFNPKKGIQSDGYSCTVFSLDALFHLSNMDTFKILEDRAEDLKK